VRAASGSYGYADFIPDDDDAAAERVKATGAIVIGKAQVPEFGYSGTGQTALSVAARPRNGDVHAHPVRALLAGEGVCQRLLGHETRHVPVVRSWTLFIFVSAEVIISTAPRSSAPRSSPYA